MTGQFIGQLILWLIVAVIAIFILYWVMHWLYRRSTKEVAFVRTGSVGARTCVVAPRLTLGGHGEDPGTTLPAPAGGGAWRDVLSGRRHEPGEQVLREILTPAPAALLIDEEALT